MTSSVLEKPVRLGAQQPRIEFAPLFASSAVDDVLDLAAVAGLVLDPWQEHVLRGSLGERVDGRWASFRTCLVVPRQNGKNAILEARELAGLLLFDEQKIIHTAHQFRTTYNSMMALMNRMRAVPALMEYVVGWENDPNQKIKDIDGFRTGNSPAIVLKSGNRLEYSARSADAGRGLTGDLVILDEAYALRLDEMAALLPTLASKSIEGNPQVWFTSSAGMTDSDMLASLRKQGMEKSGNRLAYYEWSAPDGTDPLDTDGWYQANPALGIRISEEYVRDEYETLAKDTGSDEQFKRERLGIWAKLGGESAIPTESWLACRDDGLVALADDGGEPPEALTPTRVALAVDVPPSRDVATVALAGELPDGRILVEVIAREPGMGWVPGFLKQAKDKLHPQAIVLDAVGSAGTLLGDLKRERVRTTQVSYRDLGRACGRIFDEIVSGQIAHSGQEDLNAAVGASAKTPMASGELWKWNRSTKEADISPLVAVTLARFGLEKKQPSKNAGRVIVM